KLTTLAQNGGYVCAQHHPHSEWVVGFVKPGSKVKRFVGKWGNENGCAGRTALLKALHLFKVKKVSPLDHAILQVGRPRQGTIRRWPSAGRAIKNLVEGRHMAPRFEDLNPRQQETLCSEFLRTPAAKAFGLPRL